MTHIKKGKKYPIDSLSYFALLWVHAFSVSGYRVGDILNR